VEIMPGEGPVGTTVFVRITRFEANKQAIVTFGTGTAIGSGTIVVDTQTTDDAGYAVASFDVDAYAAGRYTIGVDDGTNTVIGYFIITPQITLSGDSGYVGDDVLIDGNGFAPDKPINVYFDDTKVTVDDADDEGKFNDVRFTVPPSARGDHEIKVQDSEGNNVTAVYNVRNNIDISPTEGAPGMEVAVSGTGFESTGEVSICFDDVEVCVIPAETDGSFTANFKVPESGDGTHKIKADDDINRMYGNFVVLSTLAVSPDNGHIGMPVGVQGSGFRPGFPMTVSYDNVKMDASSVKSDGSFTFKFKIPKSKSGSHTITATDGVNVQKVTFAVESTPPLVPALTAPGDSARVIKDIHFEWGAVTDPSGVTYLLQIAADAQFSKLLLSESDLATNSYDVPAEKKLLPRQNKPYYWRVKAIDAADNESGWSGVGTFFTGYTVGTFVDYMPKWAEYGMVVLGLALLAFMCFWIGRTVKRSMVPSDTGPEYDALPDSESEWTYDTYNTEQGDWMQR